MKYLRFCIILTLWLFFAMFGQIALAEADTQQVAVNPLRLSYTTGNVSFWRSGAEDWVEARINTPIITGDALYTSPNAALELQGEGRMFIRADDKTELSVVSQTPDFLQLKVASGRVSLDIRTLPVTGYNIELATPNAVFTIDRAGYYRVDVNGDVHFITRRGGAATMRQPNGQALIILPSEEIVVSASGRAETYVAPEPIAWDRWNDERSNELMDAYSERYITPGIAGARDLDYYGNWRTTVEYGSIWVPDAMPYGWAPYSTGRWVWDPYYQWTWIDDAPWGWVPFHYGRWVHYAGYWAWAPGPVVTVRPVYAPALVAFFGVSFGSPGYGWVALGWGEPCIPWWGYRGFVGKPWWGHWGGPRLVNHKHVDPRRAININTINYTNSRVKDAVVATSGEHFGRRHMRDTAQRLPLQSKDLKPISGALPVKPRAENLVADAPRAARPPEQINSRPVVVNKRPQETNLPWQPQQRSSADNASRFVPAIKPGSGRSGVTELRRPEPGTQLGPERARPPLPPRYEEWQQQTSPPPSAAVRESVGRAAVPEANRREEMVQDPRRTGVPAVNAPDDKQPQSNRFEPRDMNDTSRWREPAASEQGVRPGVRQQQELPVMQQPQRGGRNNDMPSGAPVRIAPQERVQQAPQERIQQVPQERMQQVPAEMPQRQQRFEPMPQMEQPRGGRADLPGMPANRIYREVNPGRADFGRAGQGRAAPGMSTQGIPAQSRPVQTRPDQGRPQR